MPKYELPHVKCEPPSESDDEDSDSKFKSHLFDQVMLPSAEVVAVKLEPETSTSIEEEVDSGLMNLQVLQRSSLETLSPAAPTATPVSGPRPASASPATLETLEPAPPKGSALEQHLVLSSSEQPSEFMPLLTIKDEPSSEGDSELQSEAGEGSEESGGGGGARPGGAKSWSPRDMARALAALRDRHMSLTKAAASFGIPSTTLWQRAHRAGIDTPKREAAARGWREADLRAALAALRAGEISANKASKAYGIPSSTLYKVARREGIRLAAPFNAAPVAWRAADLARALAAIRSGRASVQRAAAHFGIPTGTLYGRCKREGIELSRSNPTPWSEDAMGEALEAVRVGQMSINQAAIHYNLPYSSLYGRFKRCKYLQSPQLVQPQQECQEMEPAAYAQYHSGQPVPYPAPDPAQIDPHLSHTNIEPAHDLDQAQMLYHPTSHPAEHGPFANLMMHEPYAYYGGHASGIATS